jgi:hypothetical protein
MWMLLLLAPPRSKRFNRPMITIACEEGAGGIVEKAATKKWPVILAWNEVET